MQHSQNKPAQPSFQELLRLAQTPEGKKLIQQISSRNDPNVKKAMESAAAGNFAPVKEMLNRMLTPEELEQLIGRLGGEAWRD